MVGPFLKVNAKLFIPITPLYDCEEVRSSVLEYVRVQFSDVNGCKAGVTSPVKMAWIPSTTKTARQ